jgi:hypothetical protein
MFCVENKKYQGVSKGTYQGVLDKVILQFQ